MMAQITNWIEGKNMRKILMVLVPVLVIAGCAGTGMNSYSYFYNGSAAYNAADYRQAARWFELSANQGHMPSQNNLGLMYEMGLGVDRSNILAYKWYLVAVFRGYEHAREDVDRIEKKLTQSQRDAGQAAAQRWIEAFEARQGVK